MSSRRPTGMGVAGRGLVECFPECGDEAAEGVYRFINDRIKGGFLKMILRQMAAEFFAWRHRGRALIFSTHQGPLLRHPRSVVIVHDFIAIRHPFQNRMQALGFLFLLPRILKKASAVVVISAHVREDLLGYFPKLCKEKRIQIIPSITPRLEVFKQGGEEWPQRLEAGRLLFVGASYLHKRLDAAIEAVVELRGKGWKVGMDIVGVSQGIWEQAYGVNFEGLKAHGIVAKPYVSDSELENLYSKAMALLFLSECEGLGFPPLEAMRKNCPVVCNDTAALRETCGEAAFFVDIARKGAVAGILEQMMSGKLAQEMKQKILLGSEQTKKYDRARITSQWVELIQEVESR
ncbi:MAG: glycosyltransferase [Verrucomicrobiota bacterium]